MLDQVLSDPKDKVADTLSMRSGQSRIEMLQQRLNRKKYEARKDESRVGVYEQERKGELLHTY